MKNIQCFALALVVGSGSLASAQLVQKASSISGKTKAGKGKSGKVTPAEPPKTLDSFGFTPRMLVVWKRTGTREGVAFRVATFQPQADQAEGPACFEIHGRDPFGKSETAPILALLRLGTTAPEISADGGNTWTQGESVNGTWTFALDNQVISLNPMDAAFTPTSYIGTAFERGSVVKRSKESSDSYTNNPYFHSIVLAVAYGKNELQGLLKFPGTTFVVPFQGIRYRDHWVARSTDSFPFNAVVSHPTATLHREGATELKGSDKYTLQLDWTEQRLLLGCGNPINYAQDGEPADRLYTASEFETSKAVSLPGLGDSYRAQINRTIWTRTDEDGSFSREADRAFAGAGLKAWFWTPWEGHGDVDLANWTEKGRASLNPILVRIRSVGGSYGLIGYNGNVVFNSSPAAQPH